MAIHTQIFRQRAGDVMRPVPLVLTTGMPCAAAVRAMAEAGASSALVTDTAGRLRGILTEQDVTRRIAFRVDGATPVDDTMTAPVHVVGHDNYLYRAIALMRRDGVRHMPVVDRDGRPVGMLDLHEAVAVTAAPLMDRIHRLAGPDTVEGLRAVKATQVGLARELFDDGVPAPEIQHLLTDINNDIYRRIVEAALAAMAAEGRGAPPVAFTLLVMGSGGRGENFLMPDQDNGFILEDYPDAEHAAIDGFFIELAERMTRDLDAVGFPYCRGNVMATNPVWRKSISQWRAQTTGWGRKRNFITARLVGIFLDFVSVYGRHDLARELRGHVTDIMRRSRGFLQELYRDEADHGTALGWFSRLLVEREDKRHKGEVNLKHTGTMPLVQSVRLLALGSGIDATGTLDRIAGLAAHGVLTADERDNLSAAFHHLTGLLLRQQIADHQAGREVSNYVQPDGLSKRDRELMIAALRAIEALRTKVRIEFTGDVF